MAEPARLREPTFLILTSLDEPRHGYGILQRVEVLSDGRVRLRAGTLYAALDRLVGEGLVEASGEEIVDGRLRRYYRLTAGGRELLTDEVAIWSANVKAAGRALRRTTAAGGLA